MLINIGHRDCAQALAAVQSLPVPRGLELLKDARWGPVGPGGARWSPGTEIAG